MNTKDLSLENQQKNKRTTWLLIFGIILIGSNLRAPLTSVGSLIPFIRDDLALNNAIAGSITTLPLIAFALLSPFVPKLANRLGMEWTIFLSMLILTTGIIVRSLADVGFLFIGTILIGTAIAFGNVLLPGFIKMNFPLKIGMMTGVYAVSMNIFGALGSGLSVPLAAIQGFGWPGALAVFACISFLAILVWVPQLLQRKGTTNTIAVKKNGNHLWKSGLAWKVTLYMGCQSFLFYTLITWLPDILRTIGYSSSAAGWMVFLMQFSVIPITFIIPIIAERLKNQIGLSIVTACLYASGILGLLIGHPTIVPVSAILIGIASGSAFSLSMMFFTLRTTDGKQAAALSGMAQSFGYLLAATGPVLIGALHDIANSWSIPLLLLIGIIGLLLLAGIGSGRQRTVGEKLKGSA
ncbi:MULTISPECIES: CynX/NimT family MFS transporter [Oceanobacillus]|uniref:MFS transporter n=1 Tax=Oceanobacillus profundus TaxID=372463 RepID=A0A417YM51_9BACI|nr:MFS transporter [Oceanobacillus profundus]MBR3119147.1 MFS transporter [Oceanobacillus sp.]MCM3400489.1 MFS transporter [Oceanobacillus profundus]PAE29473.1 MFS transporter [Paenibacillus sp. 7884-2]RHW34385.1 MFS transporter [Oceanobacillus profundus]